MKRRAIALLLLAGCAREAGPPPEPTPAVPLVGPFLFYEDFENTERPWRAEGAAGGIGWYRLNAPVCGGAYAMHMGKAIQQPFAGGSGTFTLTLATPIDLTKAKRPHLTYDVRGVADPAEAVVLQPEARRPGGAWKAVGTPAAGRYRFVFTRFADLSEFTGGPIELRFSTVLAPSAAPHKGLYLDMVQIVEPTGVEPDP